MPKRYVVADRDGQSDIVSKQEVLLKGNVDLWVNSETPAYLGGLEDPVATRAFTHEPPSGGAIFRVVTFTKAMNQITPEQAVDMHKSLNSTHVPTIAEVQAAKHPTMHKTKSLDYMILLSGRLWILSEQRDVLLEPGDYVIQKGAMHGWRVESDEPAVLACVLIDAMPSASFESILGGQVIESYGD